MSAVRFRWKKLGRVHVPSGQHEWARSHGQNPTPLLMNDRVRVYFNSRTGPDADGMPSACATFLDLALDDPTRVLAEPTAPLLPPGKLGTFDAHGVMACAVLRRSPSEVWLYYVGWSRCQGVPYNHAVGLAISHDGGTTFQRAGDGPVVARTFREPYIQNSPYVTGSGRDLHLWYSSGTAWKMHEGRAESIYVLMHATSQDGIEWQRDGRAIVPALVDNECQTNPCVIERDGRLHMWFCWRHGLDFRNEKRGYRLGYAWSPDGGKTWQRDDEASPLDTSPEGWDSEMICYPKLFTTPNGRTYLLYSGNGFGRDGFGLAVLES